MKRFIQLLVISGLALTGHVARSADLYVSPEGSDTWTGRLQRPNEARTDGPLASVVGARDAIRMLKAAGALQEPMRVHIQTGRYAICEPVVFEPQDSGTEQCPICYVGEPGTPPVISGGREVTGWRKEGDRWVAHLGEVEAGRWAFAALWVNGERRTRARMPNEDYFYDGGRIDPGAVGIWIGRTSYNQVSHNEICDLYYTGISVGWSWGYAPPSAHHNVVEFNHIHDIGRGVLGDMGGIYCLGDSPGTVLRNNLVHDVYDHHTGSLAIYTDEGSTGILIENNIGYGTTYANFHQHYGKENIVRNNIWAFGKDHQLSRSRQEDHLSFTFERNIVYFDNGKLLKGGWTNDKFVMDRNLYWDTSRPDGNLTFAGATLTEWQARGHDRHSLIADPRFVNAPQFDFRLQPDSPAFQLGFVPIDAGEIGLYGDPEWVRTPRQIKRQAYVPKTPAEPQPTSIEDDFEDSLPDMPPEGPVVSVEDVGRILVTNELAAAGAQSLKFTDSPGQKYSFNPHLWYSPHLVVGYVRGDFDVRIEPGAIGQFEWRDYSGGDYRIGPSLRIEGDGRLFSGGAFLGQVPLSRWQRIEIGCGLGSSANGKWTLRYGDPGGELREVELTCNPQFRKLDWFGLISDVTIEAVFFVDNVKIGPGCSP